MIWYNMVQFMWYPWVAILRWRILVIIWGLVLLKWNCWNVQRLKPAYAGTARTRSKATWWACSWWNYSASGCSLAAASSGGSTRRCFYNIVTALSVCYFLRAVLNLIHRFVRVITSEIHYLNWEVKKETLWLFFFFMDGSNHPSTWICN